MSWKCEIWNDESQDATRKYFQLSAFPHDMKDTKILIKYTSILLELCDFYKTTNAGTVLYYVPIRLYKAVGAIIFSFW